MNSRFQLTCGILLYAALLAPVNAFSKAANDESQIRAGTYWVPVGEQLAPYALFDIPEVKIRVGEDEIRVEYELPPELTGAINVIELEGPPSTSGTVTLRGDYGVMECPANVDFSNCAVSYKNLNFNNELRTAILSSISNTDEELRKRELVAARFQFGGEPHGFLKIGGALSPSPPTGVRQDR